jgi:hypothetical protein
MRNESPLMNQRDIVRELRLLRYDPANGRGRGRRIPINYIAKVAGLHRVTLYRAIMSGFLSEKSRSALSRALIMSQKH